MTEKTQKVKYYSPEESTEQAEHDAVVQEKQQKNIGKTAVKGEQLKEELDALLDEIDEVLEENAEQFVASYIQKGGE